VLVEDCYALERLQGTRNRGCRAIEAAGLCKACVIEASSLCKARATACVGYRLGIPYRLMIQLGLSNRLASGLEPTDLRQVLSQQTCVRS
jgi:hypothetical protein